MAQARLKFDFLRTPLLTQRRSVLSSTAMAKYCVAASVVFGAANAYVVPSSSAQHAAPSSHVSGAKAQTYAAEPEVEQTSSAWNPLAVGAAIGLMAAVVGAPAAKAADVENGGSIFGANCTACHAGGKNNVKAEKTLFPDALKANNRYENADMIAWITSGGNGMPAFGERLGPDDIEDVAAYVRGQADKGW